MITPEEFDRFIVEFEKSKPEDYSSMWFNRPIPTVCDGCGEGLVVKELQISSATIVCPKCNQAWFLVGKAVDEWLKLISQVK